MTVSINPIAANESQYSFWSVDGNDYLIWVLEKNLESDEDTLLHWIASRRLLIFTSRTFNVFVPANMFKFVES